MLLKKTLTQELEEAAAQYHEALTAFLEDPEETEVYANFRDARKDIDQAKTPRGFYPVQNSNTRTTSGMRQGNGFDNSRNPDANKDCMRCGRRGHIARNCPQRPQKGKGFSKGKGKVHFSDMSEATTVGYIDSIFEVDKTQDSIWVNGQAELSMRGKAVIDSGASDNVIGVDTLQDLADLYEELGFAVDQEFTVNRTIHNNCVYGIHLAQIHP